MKGRKRILMLLSNPFRPDPRVHREAKTLISAGHAVTVLAWDRAGQSKRKERVDGIGVSRVGPRSGYDNILSMLWTLPRFYWNALVHSRRLRQKPDVVHCHDFDTLPLGILIGRLKGCKVVYDSHESYPDMIADSAPAPVVSLVAMKERKLVRMTDAVVCTTNAIKTKFRGMGADDVVVVMNCQEPVQPVSQTTIDDLRDKLAIGNKKMVLYIGTMEKIRGLEEIVEAFSRHSGDFKLILGGYGPIEKILKRKSRGASNIKFIGPVRPDLVPIYTQASDIMFLLSDPANMQTQYCVANKVFEAMSAGKPIIVSKDTLHQKLVESTGSGCAIQYFDEAQFFDCLGRLKNEPEYYQKLSEAGRQATNKQYNWQVMGKRLADLYDRL